MFVYCGRGNVCVCVLGGGVECLCVLRGVKCLCVLRERGKMFMCVGGGLGVKALSPLLSGKQ